MLKYFCRNCKVSKNFEFDTAVHALAEDLDSAYVIKIYYECILGKHTLPKMMNGRSSLFDVITESCCT